jgi:hypothetical protein
MDIREKLEQGYIHTRTIIEVVGRPKEHVENSLKEYLGKLKQLKELEVLKQDIADINHLEKENLWTVFAELEIMFKDMISLTQFCFDFMPSSIEILAPEQIAFQNRELAIVLNNLQGKLHNLHAASKHLLNENVICKKNIQVILSNFVSILLLKSGKTLEQLSKPTGLPPDKTEILLETMIKQGRIKKEGDLYTLIKK